MQKPSGAKRLENEIHGLQPEQVQWSLFLQHQFTAVVDVIRDYKKADTRTSGLSGGCQG